MTTGSIQKQAGAARGTADRGRADESSFEAQLNPMPSGQDARGAAHAEPVSRMSSSGAIASNAPVPRQTSVGQVSAKQTQAFIEEVHTRAYQVGYAWGAEGSAPASDLALKAIINWTNRGKYSEAVDILQGIVASEEVDPISRLGAQFLLDASREIEEV
jgi:hypothetical protein